MRIVSFFLIFLFLLPISDEVAAKNHRAQKPTKPTRQRPRRRGKKVTTSPPAPSPESPVPTPTPEPPITPPPLPSFEDPGGSMPANPTVDEVMKLWFGGLLARASKNIRFEIQDGLDIEAELATAHAFWGFLLGDGDPNEPVTVVEIKGFVSLNPNWAFMTKRWYGYAKIEKFTMPNIGNVWKTVPYIERGFIFLNLNPESLWSTADTDRKARYLAKALGHILGASDEVEVKLYASLMDDQASSWELIPAEKEAFQRLYGQPLERE